MWLIVISLRQYSANGNVDDLNELIAQEADVNGTGPSLYIATPLYYATNTYGEMCFASEMKAIRMWDENCNINIFPPGHFMTSRKEISPYYNPRWEDKQITELDYSITEKDVCDSIRDSLTRAVDKRLMADVPFGVLLSGGLY